MNQDLDYLFEDIEPFGEGDEILPGITVKRVMRCVHCPRDDKFLDSIYCCEKRYWANENANLIIPHCQLFEIPLEEEAYLDCDEDGCEDCRKECIKNG